jgi:hypothetical protein
MAFLVLMAPTLSWMGRSAGSVRRRESELTPRFAPRAAVPL